ncbi:MAG: Thiopurine S-methyltransferase [Labilithrix sp.]|nr:Thiopurine S-methyltransferase [Labilithrix sp.]
MEIDYWAARWKEGRIGFHEGRTNAFLARHVDLLGPAPKRVLVPLCGKTEDMAFVASRGHYVIGIEAVEDAVKAFFAEHELVPEVREIGEHIRVYSSGRVSIFAGDLFACTKELVGNVDALYDRAALVALSGDVRPRYVAHLRELLAPQSKGIVITFEYDTSKVAPPPYSVSEAEVRRLYSGAVVTQVEEGPLDGPKFREAGVEATERCFLVTV